MRIAVFLESDESVFLKAVAAIISQDKSLAVITGRERSLSTLDFIIVRRPDIFICDIDHNGEKNGFPMLREIQRECGDTVRVIALSDCAEPEIFGAFFHHGGRGYEWKNCYENEIAIAIRCVSRGNRFICSSLGGDCLHQSFRVSAPPQPELIRKLSPQEKKVLAVLRDGGSAKDVALGLDIAVSTAEKHIERIMNKLEIHGLAKLRNSIWLLKLD